MSRRRRSWWVRSAQAVARGFAWLTGSLTTWTARFFRRTWQGRSGRFGGARLTIVSLAAGFAAGCLVMWLSGQSTEVRHVLYGEAGELPKPVTPPPEGSAWVRVLTTGYCPCAICCGSDADGVTARGRKVATHPFGIATDPNLVTPWLSLDIPGYGHARVDDTGGAMRQSAKRGVVHLDLRFRTHSEAKRWGRRWLWIAMPAGAPASGLPPPS
jgi:3D (Asp-Asp-Asp) domain-containing protein